MLCFTFSACTSYLDFHSGLRRTTEGTRRFYWWWISFVKPRGLRGLCSALLFQHVPRTLILMPAYFTPDLFRFLTRLKRNNKREWFQAHKEEYEAVAHQHAVQFITDFAAHFFNI